VSQIVSPVISVVMSVYNGERYLDEAIVSILEQTYKSFEFIIINDGSTDKSLEIIESYIKQDDRIVIINRDNKGLIASLNEGIERSRGKYIARMDADDVSLHTRFEEQIKFMEKNEDVGICGSWVESFTDDYTKTLRFPTSDSMLKTWLFFNTSFAHPTVFMRRGLLKQYGLSYNKAFIGTEDYELWIRLSEYTKFATIPKILLRYRVLESSVTRSMDKEINKRFMVFKEIIRDTHSKININNSYEYLHFLITSNDRIKNNIIDIELLKEYFDTVLKKNSSRCYFEQRLLQRLLGKKWVIILYLSFRKNPRMHLLKFLFSKYMFYALFSKMS